MNKYNKYLLGNNLIIWDNQQERLSTKPKITKELKWYLSGFVDGEGSFCLNIKKKDESKYGFTIDPAFYVYQHKSKRVILEIFKFVFGTGSIHIKSSPDTVLTYQITGIRNCYEKVLPFFRKYPLITKKETFQIFEKAIELMFKKQHLSKEGKLELLDLAYMLNQRGKGRKWNKEKFVERILRD